MTEHLVRRLTSSATLEGYDRWSKTYDHVDNPMVHATSWVLSRHPLDVAGRRVIELGCGTGRLAGFVLANGAAHYAGVDGSSGMLDRARARGLDGGRVTWARAELDRVPLPAASFERALVVLVVEHLPVLAPVAREIARLLAPGGLLRLLDIHPDLLAAGSGAHFRDGDEDVLFASVRHDVPAIEAALAEAGLTVTVRREHVADGALVAGVPTLAKHAGRRAVLDLEASR